VGDHVLGGQEAGAGGGGGTFGVGQGQGGGGSQKCVEILKEKNKLKNIFNLFFKLVYFWWVLVTLFYIHLPYLSVRATTPPAHSVWATAKPALVPPPAPAGAVEVRVERQLHHRQLLPPPPLIFLDFDHLFLEDFTFLFFVLRRIIILYSQNNYAKLKNIFDEILAPEGIPCAAPVKNLY